MNISLLQQQQVPVALPTVTFAEFYTMLREFDWHYSYSEDREVYSAGFNKLCVLRELSNRSDLAQFMYWEMSNAAHKVGMPFPSLKEIKVAYDTMIEFNTPF